MLKNHTYLLISHRFQIEFTFHFDLHKYCAVTLKHHLACRLRLKFSRVRVSDSHPLH